MCETLGTNWEDTAKEQIFLRLEADKAIQRVRKVHSPFPENKYHKTTCRSCWRAYPCETIKALDGEQ